MIKILWGQGGWHLQTPLSLRTTFAFTHPLFNIFLERPHHPTSSILHCYPFPIHHPFPLKMLILHIVNSGRIWKLSLLRTTLSTNNKQATGRWTTAMVPNKICNTKLKVFENLNDIPNSSQGYRFVAFVVLEIPGGFIWPSYLVFGVDPKSLVPE